jgi:hypothetical protein
MVNRKYPRLIVFSETIIFPIHLCPALRCEATKYHSTVGLNYSECGSFVDTVVYPWLLCELVLSSFVNPFQLCKFLIKALVNEFFMFAHFYQTIWTSQLKWWVYNFNLMLLRLRRWFLVPEEIKLSWILFLFLLLLQAYIEMVKPLKKEN